MTITIQPLKDKYSAPPTHIKDHFPADTFYPHQEATLDKIEREVLSGKKYIFLEAPTGAGKSFIGMALARWMTSWQPQVGEHDGVVPGTGAHLLTIQKILQDQYSADFPSPEMEVMKGRSNYPCDYQNAFKDEALEQFLGVTNADVAPCKLEGKGFFNECLQARICQYANAIERAEAAKIVNFNFQSWLYNTVFTDRFHDRLRLLILDEAHNVESQLMNFVSYTISDRDMPWQLPTLETAPEYITWLNKNHYEDQLRAKVHEAKGKQNVKLLTMWEGKLRGYSSIMKMVEDEAFIAEDMIKDTNGNRSVELKPLYVKRYFPRYFDADVVFFMSATILNATLVAESLGLKAGEVSFVRMPSTFPIANRPIIINTVGPMTFKHVNKTTPKMVKAVEKYLDHYKNVRGIIHCHSFKLGNAIYEGLSPSVRARVIYQKDPKIARCKDPRERMLEVLRECPNGVILAPAFHEGVDLKDDLSRFQLICKVPYPDVRSSKQLAARTDTKRGGDFRYYMWLTALKTVQSVGRSVRTPTDWAHTYILDEDFVKFVDRTRSMLPEWFTEAITSSSAFTSLSALNSTPSTSEST